MSNILVLAVKPKFNIAKVDINDDRCQNLATTESLKKVLTMLYCQFEKPISGLDCHSV